MTTNNVTGIRGNHDQKVIEWRAWMDWIRSLPGGKSWLFEFNKRADKRLNTQDGLDDDWIEKEIERQDRRWRNRIPKGWKMFSDHYSIARDMSAKQYNYLVSLPLVLHVPSAHTYLVHAGLLPYDPTFDPANHRQPLAHVPAKHKDDARLRLLQELAILHDIPQNRDSWLKINMRSILNMNRRKDSEVTKDGNIGTPWSDLWNEAMSQCAGYNKLSLDQEEEEEFIGGKTSSKFTHKKSFFPCKPVTILYGHAAGRGLDVKRWSFGVDSGCVCVIFAYI